MTILRGSMRWGTMGWGSMGWGKGLCCWLLLSACDQACQREPAAPATSGAAATGRSAQNAAGQNTSAQTTAAETAAARTAAAQDRALPGAPAALRIAYSDWPGWVAWQVAIEQRYFDELGVQVAFEWLEYVPTIEAFSEGKVDAVCMTNGDALVAGSSGAPSVGILLNDYSKRQLHAGGAPGHRRRGHACPQEDCGRGRLRRSPALDAGAQERGPPGIRRGHRQYQDARGPQLLRAGSVDAIAAWQPHSGRALDEAVGAKALFTSADVPGLIYDLLFVSHASLSERRADWVKVVAAWFRAVDFILDPQHRVEAIRIMARRMGLPEERYAKLMAGTHLLGREENQRRFRATPGLESVQGSSEIVDRFNVDNRVYKDPLVVAPYFDGSLVDEALRQK